MKFRKIIPCAILSAAFFALPATAQTSLKSLTLSESAIRAFYAEGAQIHKKDLNSFLEFTKAHFHDQAQITLQSTLTVEGHPPITNSLNLNKNDYIDTAQKSYEETQSADVQNTIKSIKITPDGKTAQVEDSTTSLGQVVKLPNGGSMLVDTQGSCKDEVVLSAEGAPQIMKSDCVMNMTAKPQSEL